MIDILCVNEEYAREYDVRLLGGIEELEEYLELLDLLYNATEFDSIMMTISGPGGDFETAVALAYAIRNCKAPVTGRLLGTAASASAMILLACDIIEVTPASRLMLHIYSGGSVGTGLNPQRDMATAHIMFKEFMYEYCVGYLTAEEIESLEVNNSDCYHNTEEIQRRITDLYKYRAIHGYPKEIIKFEELTNNEDA